MGARLKGGEFIELVGDLGAGKTAFVRGLVKGIKSKDLVQSPTFTIERIYSARDGLTIHHFDFYRLADAEVIKQELAEVLANPKAVVAAEWSDVIAGSLPANRLRITIQPAEAEDQRTLKFEAKGPKHHRLIEGLK